MTLRINTNKLKSAVIFGLLFFAAMNFFAKFFYFVFATFIFLFIIQKKLILNKTTLIYLALGALMALYNSGEGVLSMLRCMAYVLLYVVGYNMAVGVPSESISLLEYDTDSAQKTCFSMLITVATGSFAHYLLNFINNFGEILGRNTRDIWSGDSMAATGQATFACLMLGLSVAMLFLPKRKGYRYLGIACILGMFAYNLVLAGRTMIVVLFVLFIVALLYVRKAEKNSFEKLKIGIGIASAGLLLFIAFIYNVGGIQNYILDSNLFDRFGFSIELFASDASRTNGKIAFIQNAYKYPFGGLNMRNGYGYYAHDLLLDGYDEYGLIGLILLVFILVLGIRALYKLLKYTSCGKEFKLALLCIYCAILLEFCVEPILAGMQWLFACYSLINGCMDGINLSYFSQKNGASNENITN